MSHGTNRNITLYNTGEQTKCYAHRPRVSRWAVYYRRRLIFRWPAHWPWPSAADWLYGAAITAGVLLGCLAYSAGLSL